MPWNYRVIQHDYDDGDGGTETMFAIHEVYYDDAGAPKAMSAEPVRAECEDLLWMIRVFTEAAAKPILDEHLKPISVEGTLDVEKLLSPGSNS